MDIIKNKVAENTNLITIDLEDYYPKEQPILFDIKDWLYQGMVVKEKEFRNHVQSYDWTQYKDKYVVFTCSVDAIIPGWVYLLLTSAVAPYSIKSMTGSLEIFFSWYYHEIINTLKISEYKDKSIIIKGCSDRQVPLNAYLQLIEKLQPVVKSIMYGEACSSVPLYKRPRTSQ